MSKYGVIPGPYFPVLGLNTEIYLYVNVRFIVADIPIKKQPSRGVLRKRRSEKMQQIYRRTPMPIFRIAFSKITSWWLLLPIACCRINLEYTFLIEPTFAVLF